MTTQICGASDDLIEVDGDVSGESYLGNGGKTLLVCSDGTALEIQYSVPGIWALTLIRPGVLFDGIVRCDRDGEGDNYTDVARFKDGLRYVISAKEYEVMK